MLPWLQKNLEVSVAVSAVHVPPKAPPLVNKKLAFIYKDIT